jgi:hypothetical protein
LSGLALLHIFLQITILLLCFAHALLHLALGFLRRIVRGVAYRFVDLALDLLSGALPLDPCSLRTSIFRLMRLNWAATSELEKPIPRGYQI